MTKNIVRMTSADHHLTEVCYLGMRSANNWIILAGQIYVIQDNNGDSKEQAFKCVMQVGLGLA